MIYIFLAFLTILFYFLMAGLASAFFDYCGETEYKFYGFIWPITIIFVLFLIICCSPFLLYEYCYDKFRNYLG